MNLESLRHFGALGPKVVAGLERALRDVPDHLYRISITEDRGTPDGLTAEVGPSDTGRLAASVKLHIHPRSDTVWVTVGEALELELPGDRREWRPLGLETLEDDVEALAAAALNGEVEERLIVDPYGSVTAIGSISVRGRRIAVESHSSGVERTNLDRQELRYEPYAASES